MGEWDASQWSALVLALSGAVGTVTAYMLNKRGQRQQEVQTSAANSLAERAQGFDEMEAVVRELREEIKRIEASRDREAASQARRCRTALDHFLLAFTTMQGQLLSEAARQAAEQAHMSVEQHLAEDHPEPATSGE